MKKRLVICILAVICLATVAFSACSETHKVTVVAEDGSSTEYIVKDGETVDSVIDADVDLYTDEACTQLFDRKTPINGDLTLYVKSSSCTVTFVTNGGSEVSSRTVNKGDSLPSDVVTTRQNYAFAGWYSDEALEHKFDEGTAITKSITLYAKWTRTHYTVTLKVSGNEDVNLSIPVDSNTLSLAGKMDGMYYDDYSYTFTGWKDASGKDYEADATVTVTDDMVLTAQFTFNDVVYVLDDSGEYYILDSILNTTISTFTVPETYNGLPVATIRSFGSSSALKTVIIPDSVEFIESSAFANLSGLVTIDAPYIGAYLIEDLPTSDDEWIGLEGMLGYWFNFGIELNPRIGYYTVHSQTKALYEDEDGEFVGRAEIFYQFPQTLKNIIIRNGVIPEYAFYNVTTIEQVTLGDGVKAIGPNAFANNSYVENLPHNFKKLIINEDSPSFTSFGENAFRDNYSVEYISVPKLVEVLPKEVFYNCLKLKQVDIPEYGNLKVIEQQAFYIPNSTAQASLTFINLPLRLETIGVLAFCNSALTKIDFPASVTSIGGAAFIGSKALGKVTFDDGNAMTALESSVFEGCISLTEVKLPSAMHILGDSVFSGCKNLRDFSYFENIDELGQAVFNSSGFVNVTLSGIVKMGSNTFSNCDALVSVEMNFVYNDNINTKHMFDDCDALTTVTFPTGITEIGDSMFLNCDKFAHLVVPATVVRIGENACGGMAGAIETVTFEQGSVLEEIGNSAFWSRELIESISLPATITKIGATAFAFCYNLTTVTFADGASGIEIGDYAFNRNVRLESIDLSVVTSFGNSAFENCISLSDVTISDSVTQMGTYAFARNVGGNLKDILKNLGMTMDDVKELTIRLDMSLLDVLDNNWPNTWSGDAIVIYAGGGGLVVIDETWEGFLDTENSVVLITKYIGSNAQIVLPDSIQYDEAVYEIVWAKGVFESNTTITKVTLSLDMTEIPDNFFKGATKLSEVVVPQGSKLTRIGNSAFENAVSMVKFTNEGNAAIAEIGAYAFMGIGEPRDDNYFIIDVDVVIDIDFTKVVTIGESAFDMLDNWVAAITLTEITTTIGARAFYRCTAISIVFDGVLSGLTRIEASTFYSVAIYIYGDDDSSETDDGIMIIPNTVTYIGDNAFNMCRYGNICALIIEANSELVIGNCVFGGMGFYNNNPKPTQKLAYILIKGTPKYIGSEFASNNYSSTSRAVTPIFFEDVEIGQSKPNGPVESYPEGWSSDWFVQNVGNPEDGRDPTYRPVYGKGTWHYENGVPVVGAPDTDE
ncbi:MAG: leucine-rich repeat protein [Clostridiales bacterium]|nr:leucine-rich repeat protein [Clostridiales bacterium]